MLEYLHKAKQYLWAFVEIGFLSARRRWVGAASPPNVVSITRVVCVSPVRLRLLSVPRTATG